MALLTQISPLPLAFGGGALSAQGGGYGFGRVTEKESLDALYYCLERGVRIIDTAPIYGFGESERRIGKAFQGTHREKVFITSKSGVSWHPDKRVNRTNDPQTARKMFEQSLRDLNTDYIDLYMVHWPDSQVDIRRPLELFHQLKNEGKIRYLGLCNTFVEDLVKALEIDNIDVVQSEHHFFKQQDQKLLDYLEQKDISFISWGTLDKGIITGTVTEKRSFDESDARSHSPWWKTPFKDQKIHVMQNYVLPFLKEKGHSGLELALGYNLSCKGVSHMLCGGKTVLQWEGIFKALEHRPSAEILEASVKMRDDHL